MRWLELKGNFSDPWISLSFVAWASSKCWLQIKVMKKCVDFVDKPGQESVWYLDLDMFHWLLENIELFLW